MRGNVQTFMIHYAIRLGVLTYHKYMSMACATSCTVLLYYSVPWYSGHRDRVHVHTWRTAARNLWEDCYIVKTVNPYWNCHALRLFHSPLFHVFICFVCVQPAVLGRRGRNIYYTVFLNTQPDYIYLYTDILFLPDCQERSTQIFQKFVGSRHKYQIPCYMLSIIMWVFPPLVGIEATHVIVYS
jgi:hypothetical protein